MARRERSSKAVAIVEEAAREAEKYWGGKAWEFRLSSQERRAWTTMFLIDALGRAEVRKGLTLEELDDVIAMANTII